MFDNKCLSSNTLAFLTAIVLVLYFYSPVLAPLINEKFGFVYGDFSTIVTKDSAKFRNTLNYYTFVNGKHAEGTNRFFLLGSISMLSETFNFIFLFFKPTS